MKRCPYCGQEYSDENSVCSIDETPLESGDPKLPSLPSKEEKTESFATANQVAATSNAPDGFRSYGKLNPIDADRLLKKFEAAGVRFRIELGQKRVLDNGYMVFSWEYVTRDVIEIFVNNDDDERASKIVTADWKV